MNHKAVIFCEMCIFGRYSINEAQEISCQVPKKMCLDLKYNSAMFQTYRIEYVFFDEIDLQNISSLTNLC